MSKFIQYTNVPVFANFSNINTAPATGLGGLKNTNGAYVGAAKDGACVFYRPTDSHSFDFIINNAAATEYFGILVVHINKATASIAGLYTAFITIHYEAIEENGAASTANVQRPKSSLVNPMELMITSSLLPAFPTAVSALEVREGRQTKLAGMIQAYIRSLVGSASTATMIKQAFKATQIKRRRM